MPNAVVNGSPRSIGRSPGLSRPRGARARGQHQVAGQGHPVPAQERDGLPLGHARPQPDAAGRRTPSDVWQDAYSKAASCSGSLITRSPSGGVDEQVRGVLDQPGRARPAPERVDQLGRRLDPGRSAYAFQPMTPTRARRARPRRRGSSSQRPRPVARLVRQAQVLEQVTAHRAAARRRAMPQHSLPDEDRRHRRRAPTTRIASSNRGSKPVRHDRFALCSRSA